MEKYCYVVFREVAPYDNRSFWTFDSKEVLSDREDAALLYTIIMSIVHEEYDTPFREQMQNAIVDAAAGLFSGSHEHAGLNTQIDSIDQIIEHLLDGSFNDRYAISKDTRIRLIRMYCANGGTLRIIKKDQQHIVDIDTDTYSEYGYYPENSGYPMYVSTVAMRIDQKERFNISDIYEGFSHRLGLRDYEFYSLAPFIYDLDEKLAPTKDDLLKKIEDNYLEYKMSFL